MTFPSILNFWQIVEKSRPSSVVVVISLVGHLVVDRLVVTSWASGGGSSGSYLLVVDHLSGS